MLSDMRQCCIQKPLWCPKLKSPDLLCQESLAPVYAWQPSAAAHHWWGGNTQCGGGENKHSLCFWLVTLETDMLNQQQQTDMMPKLPSLNILMCFKRGSSLLSASGVSITVQTSFVAILSLEFNCSIQYLRL